MPHPVLSCSLHWTFADARLHAHLGLLWLARGLARLLSAPLARTAAAGGTCPCAQPAPHSYALRDSGRAEQPPGGPPASASPLCIPGLWALVGFSDSLIRHPRRAACAWPVWARCYVRRRLAATSAGGREGDMSCPPGALLCVAWRAHETAWPAVQPSAGWPQPPLGDGRGTCPPSLGTTWMARRHGDGGRTCPTLALALRVLVAQHPWPIVTIPAGINRSQRMKPLRRTHCVLALLGSVRSVLVESGHYSDNKKSLLLLYLHFYFQFMF